jgi:hypothetical protein
MSSDDNKPGLQWDDEGGLDFDGDDENKLPPHPRYIYCDRGGCYANAYIHGLIQCGGRKFCYKHLPKSNK